MPDVYAVAEILVEHVRRFYADDVALVVVCGSYAKGTATDTSDLDLYYIPDAGKASSLSSQFVIDGLPYDLWPVSWRMAEEIAEARSRRPWAVSASLIADTRVIYHRSAADLDRFDALKARIAALQRPESRPFMVGKAIEAFEQALFQLGQLRRAIAVADRPGTLWAGQKLVYAAANSLSLVNQTPFSKGWGANLPQILALPEKPADLESLFRAILLPASSGDLLQAAEKLTDGLLQVLRAAQVSLGTPVSIQEAFADDYFYILEYTHKVLSACARAEAEAAAVAAFHMQEELCKWLNRVENGFYPTDVNLLGEYIEPYRRAGFPDLLEPAAQGNLIELARRARQLDAFAQDWLKSHDVALNILTDHDALRAFLRQRDPVRTRV